MTECDSRYIIFVVNIMSFDFKNKTEYDFLRRLIDEKRIPDDVTIQVLCQAREHLVKKTFECMKGLKKAIFHIYNSTSPAQRKYTFNMTKEEIKKIAVDGVKCVQKYLDMVPETEVRLEYSPESFSNTEIEYSVEICEAVKEAWGATPENKIILNLPTTVECSLPNIHADQIEYFCKHISNRDSVIVSLHNHNDRGTGVASCELGLLAGADRDLQLGQLAHDLVSHVGDVVGNGVHLGRRFRQNAVCLEIDQLGALSGFPLNAFGAAVGFQFLGSQCRDGFRRGSDFAFSFHCFQLAGELGAAVLFFFQLGGQFGDLSLQGSHQFALVFYRGLFSGSPQLLIFGSQLIDHLDVLGIDIFQVMNHVFAVKTIESGTEILRCGHERSSLHHGKDNGFLNYITGIVGKQPFSGQCRKVRQKIFSPFLFTKIEKTAIIS